MAIKMDDPTLDAALKEMGDAGTFDADAPLDALPGDEPAPAPEPTLDEPPAPEPEPAPDGTGDAPKPDDKPAPEGEESAKPESEVPPDDDPLAGTKPFQYELDGQPRIFDAILEIEGEGGIIPPDKMDDVRNVFAYAERAHLEREQLLQKLAQYDSALTAKNGDTELRGTEAFQHLQAEVERVNAGGATLLSLIRNPDFIIPLGFAMQEGDQAAIAKFLGTVDANGKLIPGMLQEKLESAVTKAEYKTILARTTPKPSSADTSAEQKTQAVANAIRVIAKQHDGLNADDLTAADRAFSGLAHSLARAATAQDVAKWPNAGFKVGELIVDRSQIESWLQERAEWRRAEAKKEQDRQARDSAADKSKKFNAGQQRSRQPAPSAGKSPAAPAKPAQSAPKSRAAAWNEPLAAALDEMGIPPA